MVEKLKLGRLIRTSIVLSLVTMLLLGVVIPTATAFISENVDRYGANGSQVHLDGKVYGSYLLAQAFNESYFFQPRPSAINYNETQSGSICCSPNTNASINLTEKNLRNFEEMNPNITLSQIPGEAIMDSDSGLDPNVPLSLALLEEPRVAKALENLGNNSGVSLAGIGVQIMHLINTSKKQNFPIFGSYYVNTMYLDVNIIEILLNKGVINQSSLD